MAAHSFLQVGGLWILAYREWYSEALAAAFRDEENVDSVEAPCYSLPAGHMKARLNVLGFTSEVAASALQRAHAALLEYGEEGDDVSTFDEWIEADPSSAPLRGPSLRCGPREHRASGGVDWTGSLREAQTSNRPRGGQRPTGQMPTRRPVRYAVQNCLARVHHI